MVVAVGTYSTIVLVGVVAAAIAGGARFAFFIGGLLVGGFVLVSAVVLFWAWVAEAVV